MAAPSCGCSAPCRGSVPGTALRSLANNQLNPRLNEACPSLAPLRPALGQLGALQACAADLCAAQERRNPILFPREAARPRATRCFGAGMGTANLAPRFVVASAGFGLGVGLNSGPSRSLQGYGDGPNPLPVPSPWCPRSPPRAFALGLGLEALSRFAQEPAGCELRLGGLKNPLVWSSSGASGLGGGKGGGNPGVWGRKCPRAAGL